MESGTPMDEETPIPARPRPSQIPSWVTLGFVLGALVVLAIPRRGPVELPARPATEEIAVRSGPIQSPKITTIEAVFTDWDRYAVWSDGRTEVALWNSETQKYSDCYEVLKVGDDYYFRSITRLTRPVLNHGVDPHSPLLFTETARQRQEWLGEIQKESWKSISEGTRDSLAPSIPQRPSDGK